MEYWNTEEKKEIKMEKTEERGIGSGLCFHTQYSNIPFFQSSCFSSFHYSSLPVFWHSNRYALD
jgi:hypothetical protein